MLDVVKQTQPTMWSTSHHWTQLHNPQVETVYILSDKLQFSVVSRAENPINFGKLLRSTKCPGFWADLNSSLLAERDFHPLLSDTYRSKFQSSCFAWNLGSSMNASKPSWQQRSWCLSGSLFELCLPHLRLRHYRSLQTDTCSSIGCAWLQDPANKILNKQNRLE